MDQQKTTDKSGDKGSEPTMGEIRDHMKEDFSQLREAAEQRRDQVLSQVKTMVNEHPIATMGIAFGAGYILSGALLSRFTARIVGIGARWYIGRMVRDVVGSQDLGGLLSGGSKA